MVVRLTAILTGHFAAGRIKVTVHNGKYTTVKVTIMEMEPFYIHDFMTTSQVIFPFLLKEIILLVVVSLIVALIHSDKV
uniref:Group-specific protein n=1 Tax=Loa loa TaxID=7209 RepID=A0A1I7VL44_LOALO